MNMKKIAIFLMVTGLFASSCDLEVDPQQSIDASEALNTSQKVESAVIGMYSTLGRGALYGTNFLLLPELVGAESNVQWRGTFQSFRQVNNKNMDTQNTEASRTWINAYDGINLANNILAALDVVDDEIRDQIEGEALFVRAILHFELVRLYARPYNDGNPATNLGVPIKTTPTTNEETASVLVGRNTVQEVYDQVIQDLTNATTLLPEENGNRATTWAASAFLARVYLQMGNFAEARDAANTVIQSGFYNLNPTVTAAFLNDNTAESVFEIQQNDQNNAGGENDGMATFYASLVGIGRGDVQVLSFYNDDPEDYIFLQRVTTYDLYEDQDTRKDPLVYVGVGRRAGRLYSAKWTSPGQNLPIIRLAEMYLIRAEANLEEGTNTGADPVDDVNIVRERAGASLLGAVTLDDVYLERRLELAFEGHRGHDIKRLEQDLEGWSFDDDLNTYVLLPENVIPWDSELLVFPIPQREVDANSVIAAQQNPGY
jgi:starch-binding outer membrane protein, SusD/RagB family